MRWGRGRDTEDLSQGVIIEQSPEWCGERSPRALWGSLPPTNIPADIDVYKPRGRLDSEAVLLVCETLFGGYSNTVPVFLTTRLGCLCFAIMLRAMSWNWIRVREEYGVPREGQGFQQHSPWPPAASKGQDWPRSHSQAYWSTSLVSGGSRPTATAEIVRKRGCEPPVEGPGLILEFVGSYGEQLRHLASGQRKRSDEWQKARLCWQPPLGDHGHGMSPLGFLTSSSAEFRNCLWWLVSNFPYP